MGWGWNSDNEKLDSRLENFSTENSLHIATLVRGGIRQIWVVAEINYMGREFDSLI